MLIIAYFCRAIAVIGLLYTALTFSWAYHVLDAIDKATAARMAKFHMSAGIDVLLISLVLGVLAQIIIWRRRNKDG